MGFEFALDELYATGWSPLDSSGCTHHSDGRSCPTTDRIHDEFARAGLDLRIKRIDLFDCSRAEWAGPGGESTSAVGQTDHEAAVFALAKLRREMMLVSTA